MVSVGEINERRPRGHPRQRWMDTLKEDLGKIAPRTKLEEP